MILVMGATGQVGSAVVRGLLGASQRPRAFTRDPGAARERLGEDADFIGGDFGSPGTIDRAVAGVERVLLLTPQDVRQPQWEAGVIEAAGRAGVRHVVKLSVFRADETSPLQFVRQHRQSERALEASGLAFTILRPVFFMQNLLAMVREGILASAAEDGRVAMIDARDVAAVAVTALTEPGYEGKTYTLTGPEALTFDEVAAVLSARDGTPVRHLRVPSQRVRLGLEAAGIPAWFAADMATLHELLASGYEDLVTDDVQSVTGQPPRGLSSFAGDFAGSSESRIGR
jgi:uncharacterized protein YbjT (DUF2867 family)